MTLLSLTRPDPKNDISIVHIIKQLYSTIYQVGNKLPKREKLGIHADIERVTLDTMTEIIRASLLQRSKKIDSLEKVRVSIEVIKHLIRTEYELKIIVQKTYIRIESLLVEISKMTNGWIKYLTQNPTK